MRKCLKCKGTTNILRISKDKIIWFCKNCKTGGYIDYGPGLLDVMISRDEKGQLITNVEHKIVKHSPSGFEIGFEGSGPAELALNIIYHYTGLTDPELYHAFKKDFIALMSWEGGVIKKENIKLWLAAKGIKYND